MFYGTLPLILTLVAIGLREQMLLKDILARFRPLAEWIKRIGERLMVETRAA